MCQRPQHSDLISRVLSSLFLKITRSVPLIATLVSGKLLLCLGRKYFRLELHLKVTWLATLYYSQEWTLSLLTSSYSNVFSHLWSKRCVAQEREREDVGQGGVSGSVTLHESRNIFPLWSKWTQLSPRPQLALKSLSILCDELHSSLMDAIPSLF